MANVEFKWDDGGVTRRIAELPEKLNSRIRDTIKIAAERGQTEMKEKAPWTDVTGAARQGLFTEVVEDNSGMHLGSYSGALSGIMKYNIIFGHTVDYGIYLETMQNGKWQIIMPTMKATGDALMYSMVGLLTELDAPAAFVDFSPEVGERGTSQGPTVATERELRTFKRTIRRSSKGRFYAQYRDIATGKFISAKEAFARQFRRRHP